MVQGNELISIIMPTFNRGGYIGKALDSIIAQSYQNWECIIIDDGSTDETEIVLKSILKNDERIKYIYRSFHHVKGPSGSRNEGIDIALGKYIIFFDSDDIVHPDTLKICLELIQGNNVVFCRYDKQPFKGNFSNKHFNRNNDFDVRHIELSDIDQMITNQLAFACCTVMWSRSAIGDLRFNEELSYAEEWEFYTRILLKNIRGVSINKVLYFNRKHALSNTGEFWAKHPERRISKVKAVKQVIKHLNTHNLLSPFLQKHFLRTGFFLKDYSIIKFILKESKSGWWKQIKYKGGYLAYPVIRPFFKILGKMSANK